MLEQLVGGRFTLERADGPRGQILRGGRRPAPDGDRLVALNDIVVARGSLARVVRLDVAIDDVAPRTFVADGLVVASPTGSTGYSFSAGGPILDPTEPEPRRHADRRLPVGDPLGRRRPTQVVRCRVVDAHEALVSIDGREDIPIEVGDVVEVRALERPIRLVEPEGAHAVLGPPPPKVELLPS